MQIKKSLLALLVLICFFLISAKESYAFVEPISFQAGGCYSTANTGDYFPINRARDFYDVNSGGYSIGTSTYKVNLCKSTNSGASWTSSGVSGLITDGHITGYTGTSDGWYWVYIYDGTGGTTATVGGYMSFSILGGVITINPDYFTGMTDSENSRFTTFTVDPTTGYATVTGHWTASSTPTESQQIHFWQSSPVFGKESFVSLTATTTGDFRFSFPFKDSTFQISATSTSYTLGTDVLFHAEIYQLYSNYNAFENSGTPPLLLTATTTSLSSTTTVSVNSQRSLLGLPEPAECGLTALTGCLKNAGVWLFYPSQDSVDSFRGLSGTLSGKFPFAYAYEINELRQELFGALNTSTTTISLNFKIIPGHATSTLTLLSSSMLSAVPYSGTIKTILAWILWLLAIEYVYYRVIRAHDPHTPS